MLGGVWNGLDARTRIAVAGVPAETEAERGQGGREKRRRRGGTEEEVVVAVEDGVLMSAIQGLETSRWKSLLWATRWTPGGGLKRSYPSAKPASVVV